MIADCSTCGNEGTPRRLRTGCEWDAARRGRPRPEHWPCAARDGRELRRRAVDPLWALLNHFTFRKLKWALVIGLVAVVAVIWLVAR